MSDQNSEQTKKKNDILARENLGFFFQAAMPIVIAVVGIVFTYTNNKRQIEFQQIQVADALVGEVKEDVNFTQEKLDLKLNFVDKLFRDEHFKKDVKDLLLQTYAVTLKGDAATLQMLAASSDPADIQYVQSRIEEAKKFGDTSINNVVQQLEKDDDIKRVADAGEVKQQAREQIQNGQVTQATIQDLKRASALVPQDSSLDRLIKKAERQQQRQTAGNAADQTEKKQVSEPQQDEKDEKKTAQDTTKNKKPKKKK